MGGSVSSAGGNTTTTTNGANANTEATRDENSGGGSSGGGDTAVNSQSDSNFRAIMHWDGDNTASTNVNTKVGCDATFLK